MQGCPPRRRSRSEWRYCWWERLQGVGLHKRQIQWIDRMVKWAGSTDAENGLESSRMRTVFQARVRHYQWGSRGYQRRSTGAYCYQYPQKTKHHRLWRGYLSDSQAGCTKRSEISLSCDCQVCLEVWSRRDRLPDLRHTLHMNLRFYESLANLNQESLRLCNWLKEKNKIHDHFLRNGFSKVVVAEKDKPIKVPHPQFLRDKFDIPDGVHWMYFSCMCVCSLFFLSWVALNWVSYKNECPTLCIVWRGTINRYHVSVTKH